MIIFLFGIIIGILLSLIVFVVTLWTKPKIERQIKQTESKLKAKGMILEPESEELENWIKKLPQDE